LKLWLIRFLLRLLGAPQPLLPNMRIYALVVPGERVAEVTTNLFRARAMAIEMRAKREQVKVLRFVPVTEERLG
jgi:hypothetical protein